MSPIWPALSLLNVSAWRLLCRRQGPIQPRTCSSKTFLTDVRLVLPSCPCCLLPSDNQGMPQLCAAASSSGLSAHPRRADRHPGVREEHQGHCYGGDRRSERLAGVSGIQSPSKLRKLRRTLGLMGERRGGAVVVERESWFKPSGPFGTERRPPMIGWKRWGLHWLSSVAG